MRILFITSTRLGDAVLSTGLLRHLLAQHPHARFTVACGPVAAGVFARMPRLERLIVVEKRPFNRHWFSLWRQLVGTRWDQVVDLRGSALSVALLAGKRAIMRGGRRPGHRLTHLAGALNLATPPLPIAWTSEADDALARRLIGAGGPVIGLGPTANWDGKIWPPEHFAALFERLAAGLPGARAAIFGGPGAQEAGFAAPVLAALPNAINLVGKLSLPEAAACLRRCALFVGNDSGLMHLAASAGVPTLGLFGPTPADEYAPAGPATAVALAEGAPGQAPMSALPVETALAAARALLAAHPPKQGHAVAEAAVHG